MSTQFTQLSSSSGALHKRKELKEEPHSHLKSKPHSFYKHNNTKQLTSHPANRPTQNQSRSKTNQYPEVRVMPNQPYSNQPGFITETQLESLVRKAFKKATSKYDDNDEILKNIHSIKLFVLSEVSAYLFSVDIAEKRIDQLFSLLVNQLTPDELIQEDENDDNDEKNTNYPILHKYFDITNFLTNITKPKAADAQHIIDTLFPDWNTVDKKSLYKAKEIELQTGFPLLSWFFDMYSRDRIANAFNVNPAFNKDYTIDTWFKDNAYAKYVTHSYPNIADKLKEGIQALSHLLPPIKLTNIKYTICDNINKFALYTIASHKFIEWIVKNQLSHAFPVQIDIKIVPEHINNRRYSTDLEHILRKERYILNTDYFVEDGMRSVDYLVAQFKRMWIHKGDGNTNHHRRYLFIIERTNDDSIYLIVPKSQPAYTEIPREYYYAHESLLHLSQKDRILGELDASVLSLSFHLFHVDCVKAYCNFGVNGGAMFELNDMKWLWDRYFMQKNGRPQQLDEKYINLMSNTKKLPNEQFKEFSTQSHDESNAKLKVTPSGFYDTIETIKEEIQRIFRIQKDDKFAHELKEAFNRSIFINTLQDIEALKEDIKDIEKSQMLQYIYREMDHLLLYPESDKKRISTALQDIISLGKARQFDIKNWKLGLKKRDVLHATEYFQKEAPDISIHRNLRNPSAEENPNKRANVAEDKSMNITKAVDLKNGYPIGKYLQDAYSRDRIDAHKALYTAANVPFYEYQYNTDKYVKGYNATRWWLRYSPYCKYIQHINPKMSLPMMTAVQALCKRALPSINLDWTKGSVIHDNFNSITQHMLASYGFVHELTQNMEQSVPIQVEFCVIPQLVTPIHKEKYNKTGTYNRKKRKVTNQIWDLSQYLMNAGYVQNKDFLCMAAQHTVTLLIKQFHELWQKIGGDRKRYRRYVIVVDRRNPMNIAHRNMGYVAPKYWRKTKKWNDKIYLIIPKEGHKISTEIGYLPELFHAYSNKYLLPKVGILDPLNGYRLGLSYHVLDHKTTSVYFYANQGGNRFHLKDIEWLWPRYFNKFTTSCEADHVTKYGEQRLNTENRMVVSKYIAEKRLLDEKFEEFLEQSHSIRVVNES